MRPSASSVRNLILSSVLESEARSENFIAFRSTFPNCSFTDVIQTLFDDDRFCHKVLLRRLYDNITIESFVDSRNSQTCFFCWNFFERSFAYPNPSSATN